MLPRCLVTTKRCTGPTSRRSRCSPTARARELDEVVALADGRAVDPGTVIVREGDAATEFFVVGSGEVSVSRGGKDVARLGPGSFFGEIALFDDTPRTATVTATTGTTLVAVDRDAFQQLLADIPGLRDGVLRGMAHRLHELDAKA